MNKITAETNKTSTVEEVLKHKIPISSRKVLMGIYFLIQDDEVVYVGRSGDVEGRISSHQTGPKEFNHYSVIGCETEEELDRWEPHFIEKIRPPLNKKLPNTGEFISVPQAKLNYNFDIRELRRAVGDHGAILYNGIVYYRKEDVEGVSQ